MKTVEDCIKEDWKPYLKRYNYQKGLTKELDKFKGDFDQAEINRLVLWKVNRYAKIPSELLVELNKIKDLKPGQHRKAREVLEKLLHSNVRGVDLAMASTFLRFRNPHVFQIIDQRAFRVIYGEKMKGTGTPKEKTDKYFEYLDKLRKLCEKKNVAFEKIDRILYELDKEKNREL